MTRDEAFKIVVRACQNGAPEKCECQQCGIRREALRVLSAQLLTREEVEALDTIGRAAHAGWLPGDLEGPVCVVRRLLARVDGDKPLPQPTEEADER